MNIMDKNNRELFKIRNTTQLEKILRKDNPETCKMVDSYIGKKK